MVDLYSDQARYNVSFREYYNCVKDILHSDEVQRLDSFSQHAHVSRLNHSISVSYYSFMLCKKLGLDARAAARGGLLHDLFFYDWRDKVEMGWHVVVHPIRALENAEKLCELTPREKEIIVKHMFPFCRLPKYPETHIVSLMDKVCACSEVSEFIITYARRRRERARVGAK